jgi:hypothetical protein
MAKPRRFGSSQDDVRSMYKVLPIDNEVVVSVSGNVGGENRGEFALYRMDGHAWLLLIRI